jgi:ethanolamine utilization protein EutQ (cupin superfamily)
MTVERIPREPLTGDGPEMAGRGIVDPDDAGWQSVAVMEWELRAAEWTDRHPYDELNFVLDGELHVESDGLTVVARTGDTVRVAAGSTGRYSAPTYARMLAIYGPNPDGFESDSFALRPLEP